MSRLQITQPPLIINHWETHVLHLPQTLPHHVDVVDVEEHELCVLITVLILVSSTLGHVSHSVHLWSCIINIDPEEENDTEEVTNDDYSLVRLCVGLHDLLEESLISLTSSARQTNQRLGTPGDGGQGLRVQPGQYWKTTFRPEPGHIHQLLC